MVSALLGEAGVLLGFLGAVVGAGVVAAGLVTRRSSLLSMGRRFSWLVLAGAIIAVAAMERALLTDDFALRFVADNSARATPLVFKVATMWSALEGSILLWTLVLGGYIGAVTWRFRAQQADPLVGWAMLTLFVVAGFFFGLMLGPADPFVTVAGTVPADGPGPNPLLQNHILMAVHPPMLYLGYVGFTVPFAFAVAALATGRVGEGWLLETRRWTLFAWGFLSSGIILGGWWSYEVLGWGGFWAWDPVENASLLPWLTGTAYLHSVIVQERRGMLRVWNLGLLAATFSLTILGTFITRSGVLDSVHAFTESPIGPAILAFFAMTVLAAVGLMAWRGDSLRSPGSIDSPLSREGAFLVNNLLFAGFAFVVLLGTVFPLIVEAVDGRRISVGRPYFDRMILPLAIGLLALMAVAPVLPWRRAHAATLPERLRWPAWFATATLVFAVAVGARGVTPLVAFLLGGFGAGTALRQLIAAVRRQGLTGLTGRTNGGMIVHLGVILVAVAITANQSYSARAEVRLRPGESVSALGHTLTYVGTTTRRTPTKVVTAAEVRIDGGRPYRPALSTYPFASQAIGTPSVRTGFAEDDYLTLLASPRTPDGTVLLGFSVQPMVLWLWVGGGLMALGTILAAIPLRRRRKGATTTREADLQASPRLGVTAGA